MTDEATLARLTRPPIFISYARQDGRALARALHTQLETRGFTVWRDVADMRSGEKWWLQIAETIERSSVMVLLVTDAALRSRVMYDEWVHARTVGTPVIPVIVDEEIRGRLPRWLRKVDVVILDEHHPDHTVLRQRFLRQLIDPPARRPRPFTVPDLPRYFVPRPHELAQIIGNLLDPSGREAVPGSVAIHGGGGFGKTTLAVAVCHDEQVRTAFDDGVLWVQFGQRTTRSGALALLNDQIMLLDPRAHPFSDISQASARFRDLLADRDVLIVLDDVWSESYLPYFIHQGRTHLITTRLGPVLARTGARQVSVDEMRADEATDLLGRWLSGIVSAADRALLVGLARRLGQWALLLELVGAELNSLISAGRGVADAVTYVERRLERRGFTYLDREDEDDRNAAIGLSLNASMVLLPDDQRVRFTELGVFPAGADVPFDTVAQLWAGSAGYDELDSEDALEAMYRLALFTRYDARVRLLRLHDIVRQVIVRRSGDLAVLHRTLVDAWSDRHRLPDTYAWTYLIHHLHQLGRTDEIRRLLFDFDWIYRRLRATTLVSLIDDYTERGPDGDCRLVASALKMSGAVSPDPIQLAAQLVGRLGRVASDRPSIGRLLDRAREYDEDPMLIPQQVHLLPADRGVHTTIHAGGPVLDAVLTPDHAYLITGGYDGTAGVWDWRRHELVTTMPCQVGPIWSLVVQGDLLAVGGCHDHWIEYPRPRSPVQVWNWRTGDYRYDLGADVADINEGYHTHLHGDLVAVTTGAMNNRIEIHDWVARVAVTAVEPEAGGTSNRPGTALIVPPYLFYHLNSSNRTYLWEMAGWRYAGAVVGQVGFDSAAFVMGDRLCLRSKWPSRAPGAASFCYRAEDSEADWAARGTIGRREVWHYDATVSATATYAGHLLVASEVVDLYDRIEDHAVSRLEGHSALISGVQVTDDAILTTSYDGTIRIWESDRVREDLAAGQLAAPRELTSFHQPGISCLGVEGDSVFVGTEAGQLQERDWRTGALRTATSGHQPIQALAVNDRWLVFSAYSSFKHTDFQVRDRARWTEVPPDAAAWSGERFPGTGNSFVHLDCQGVTKARLCDDWCAIVVQNYYTPRNSLGAGTYTGNRIWVVNLRTDTIELVVGEWISAVAITPDLVVGGSHDGQIAVWQRATGELVERIGGHEAVVTDLQVHDRVLYSCAADRTVRSWDLAGRAAGRTFGSFSSPVNSLHVRGDLLLAAADDHTLKVFHRHSGAELARFDDDVSLAVGAVCPDSATFTTGGKSGYLHILRANGPLREVLRAECPG